jgi:hypothetical protein
MIESETDSGNRSHIDIYLIHIGLGYNLCSTLYIDQLLPVHMFRLVTSDPLLTVVRRYGDWRPVLLVSIVQRNALTFCALVQD